MTWTPKCHLRKHVCPTLEIRSLFLHFLFLFLETSVLQLSYSIMMKNVPIYANSSLNSDFLFSFRPGLIMGSGVFFYLAECIWQNCSSALTALMSSGVTCLIRFEFKSTFCNEIQIYSHSSFMSQKDPPLKVHKDSFAFWTTPTR